MPSSNTLLAFAEGQADGCRPDANRNRPIVVRRSTDGGQTWGPIRIAGPALATAGTNYPGAFMRGRTVVLRYSLTNGSVFSVESEDEGERWSQPVEATQPPGSVRCGSAWPLNVGGHVLLACGGGSALSSDGGRTWTLSETKIVPEANVTGMGEMMLAPNGISPSSVSMFIRAGSADGWLTHAIAHSGDLGRTWGKARLLPIVGATCEGSIGRVPTAPPGQVLLATVSGHVPYRLGRGNISVWTMDTASGADPVSRAVVWPQAAGYSDMAVSNGTLQLLFEGGGSVYDYGMKLAQIQPYPR